MTEPGQQLNNHTAGLHGRCQNSQAQAIHVNQLRIPVVTIPQHHQPATRNTHNAHVSGVRDADCNQVFSMKPNASTYSAMQGCRPGSHSSMPGDMHQGHCGYSHGSHAGHHMDSHMDSHPATFHVQETNFSSGQNGYRGKFHPSSANNMTHFGHSLTDGPSSSGASSSGDGSGDGASSSGDGSGGVSRRAPAFQVNVLHGDQELKVRHDQHLFDKSEASLHSFGRPSRTALSMFGICFHSNDGNGCSKSQTLASFAAVAVPQMSNPLCRFAAVAKAKSAVLICCSSKGQTPSYIQVSAPG